MSTLLEVDTPQQNKKDAFLSADKQHCVCAADLVEIEPDVTCFDCSKLARGSNALRLWIVRHGKSYCPYCAQRRKLAR